MKSLNQSAPVLLKTEIPILIYADDMVILSLTKLGLNNRLRELTKFCKNNQLTINYSKTKIMSFGMSKPCPPWKFESQCIEQPLTFRYLGISFHQRRSWSSHLNSVILAASRAIAALLKFFYNKGGQMIPPIRKAYISKVPPMLLYGVEIWGLNLNCLQRLEILQNQMARKLLGLPKGTVAAQLRIELGLPSIVATAHIRILTFYKKMMEATDCTLAKEAFLRCSSSGTWLKDIEAICARHSLPPFPALSSWSREKIRDTILASDEARDLAISKTARLSIWLPRVKAVRFLANYLSDMLNPALRRAFSLARFHAIPTAFLQGIYNGTPLGNRLCPCNSGQIEDYIHFFLSCPVYEPLRGRLVQMIPPSLAANEDRVVFLLADADPRISQSVAIYVLQALKLRAALVSESS